MFCPKSAQLLNDVCSCNMVRGSNGSNFQLLYRVIFFCFCLSFACFYHHGSGNDKQGDKTELIKLHDKFTSKYLNEDVFLKQYKSVPNLKEKVKRDNAWRKANLSRMNKKGKFGRHENVAFERKIPMPVLTIISF